MKKTQKQRVLDHMRTYGYVTALDGFMSFNPPITQVHTVIHELSKDTGSRYARWSVIEHD